MKDAFTNGYDFHEFIAYKIYHARHELKEGESPNKQQRRVGKGVNFGYVFGASESKINATAGIDGLMKEVNKMFPTAHKFMKETKSQVGRTGKVFTPGGYPLVVDQVHKGVNYKVQGSEGELVKRAMIDCHRYLVRNRKADIHLIMAVHDELVFDCPLQSGIDPDNVTYDDCPHLWEIQQIMENAGKFYGMVTPVEPELILTSWDKGISVVPF